MAGGLMVDAVQEAVRVAMSRVMAEGHCIICAAPPVFAGVFLPNEAFAKRIGQPKGKRRAVVYGLCDACMHLPDSDRNARVESAILATGTVH